MTCDTSARVGAHMGAPVWRRGCLESRFHEAGRRHRRWVRPRQRARYPVLPFHLIDLHTVGGWSCDAWRGMMAPQRARAACADHAASTQASATATLPSRAQTTWARSSARRTFFGYSSAQNDLVHLDASAASHSVPWPSGHGRARAGAPSCRPSSAKARAAGGRVSAAAATGREGMRAGTRALKPRKPPASVRADKAQAQGSEVTLACQDAGGRSATSTYGASGGNQALWLVAVHLR